jgi:UDP-N-acetylglucosamine 4-epimerase
LYEFLRVGLAVFDPAIASIEPQYVEPRQGDIPHSLASIEKTNRLLGYNPEYDLRSGLQHSIKWYWDNIK